MRIKPGTIVTVDFAGATGIKRRPAIVVSSDIYHTTRPDVILAVVTTRTATATAPTDYLLQDWSSSGLHKSSAVRCFLVTLPAASAIAEIGQLSARDWQEVPARLRTALTV